MKFNSRLIEIGQFPFAELFARKKELIAEGKKIFDLSIGDPREPTPEFIREALKRNIPQISQYPTAEGTSEFQAAAAAYLQRRFGVKLNAETQILPSLGSKESIYNLCFLFGNCENKKDTLIAPSPGYFVPAKSAIMNGMQHYAYELKPENGYLLEFESLDPKLLKRTALAWINYPHNPTGSTCSLEYLQRQAAIAKEYDFLLCSDECYTDIYFGSAPPSVLETGLEGVLAFFSCSKRSGMTGYRSGFIAGDEQVIEKYRGYRNTIGAAPTDFVQGAAAAAWTDDQHATQRREIFREKRSVFHNFFSARGFAVHPSDATLYLWVKTPTGQSSEDYAKQLLEKGIAVSPGSFFGSKSSQYFRVALSLSLAECKAAVEHWKSL